MASRVPHVGPDCRTGMRAYIAWEDAALVDHLRSNDYGSRSLDDLVAVAVHGGNYRAEKAPCNAAVIDVHVCPGIRDTTPFSGIGAATVSLGMASLRFW